MSIGLSILAFPVAAFVVSSGAGLAGYDPSGDVVVPSVSQLVVATLLDGVPFGGTVSRQSTEDHEPAANLQ